MITQINKDTGPYINKTLPRLLKYKDIMLLEGNTLLYTLVIALS